MDAPEAPVAIFENNKTRAELYALWLESYEVRVAASKQAAQKHIQNNLAVAVVNEGFADGAAETLVEIIRAELQLCRVLTIRPRSAAFPDVESELSLSKPVFEEDLRENVERLLCRHNYHRALRLYYRITTSIAARDVADDDSEEIQELRETASSLQSQLEEYREQLSEEDIVAVRRTLELNDAAVDSEPAVSSKYRPDRCPNCKEEWVEEDDSKLKRIAAYVWRCTGCGDVIMDNDPSHQQTYVGKR